MIGAYFKLGYQILWTVYRKERGDSIYQLHIIVNSVSFVDGKLYNSSTEELSRFCANIQRCIGSACVYRFAEQFSSDDT